MKSSTHRMFIKLGTWWGMIAGFALGLFIAVALLVSNRSMALLEALIYVPVGAGAGALLGAFQGVNLSWFTGTARYNPESLLYPEGGMTKWYRLSMVGYSALLAFLLPFLLALKGLWQIELGRGFAVSAIAGCIAGFVGYKIADWYMEHEFPKENTGESPEAEYHPTLDQILERQQNRQRNTDVDSDIQNHQQHNR
jgi:hypothetical protein